MNGLYTYLPERPFERILPDSLNAQVNDMLKTNGEKYGSRTIVTASSHTTRYAKMDPLSILITDRSAEGIMVSCLLIDSRQRLWPGPMVWGSAITT
jgi:hypothetical protein